MDSEGYEFSAPFHAHVLGYSPGTTFLATAFNDRVIVRSTSSLQIVRTWQCLPSASGSSSSSRNRSVSGTKRTPNVEIDSLEWSPDTMYLLAYASKAETAWVFALTRDGDGASGEIAKLEGGVEGLVRAEWGKRGEVLAWSDHGLKLTVWDLTTGDGKIIQYPKSHNGCHAWSPDGRYFAVVERHSGKDHVGVYDTYNQFALLRHFALRTNDVQGISWSPCGKYLAAFDSPPQYALHVHSPLGPNMFTFSPERADFALDLPPDHPVEDPGLGIRSVHWAPGGRWIALAGWDGKVRILESESGRCISVITPATRAGKGTTVWREPDGWIKETRGRGIVQFDRLPSPVALPTLRPDVSVFPPRSGVSHLAFAPCATLLCFVLATQPSVVHICSFLPEPAASHPLIRPVATLLLGQGVRGAVWAPKGRRLALWTRGGGVYFWDRDGWADEADGMSGLSEGEGGMMEGVGVPARTDFAVFSTQWAPDGTSLAISDKDQFCVLYDAETDAAAGADLSVAERELQAEIRQNESWMVRGQEGEEEGLSEVLEEESFWTDGRGALHGAQVVHVGA